MKFKKKESKNNSSESKDLKVIKEKITTKIINTIKKRWLITGTNTLLLIAILIAIAVFINLMFSKLNITPIDCTSNKQYTLTEESKERIKKIDNKVDMYFIGYEEDDTTVSLARQYKKSNDNININVIDLNERTDIASKYQLSSGSNSIVVECNEKNKVIDASELYTYDSNYNSIDITEEKLTSAILNVTAEKVAKVYFLSGYSKYTLEQSGGMYILSTYLDNEILNYENLDIMVSGSIPEDCDTLVITTPSKDFDDLTTSEIEKYINKGGNILWLNSCYGESVELKNVNKILAIYGIKPFDVGYVYETNIKRTVLGYSSCILEDLGKTDIDSKLKDALLLNATKINFASEELEALNVEEKSIIETSDEAFFRKDINKESDSTDGDEEGPFTIGAMFTKTIDNENDEENKLASELIIFGDNNYVSDIQINQQVYPLVYLYDNKDLMLNSIAYLTDQDEDITIRKDYTRESSFTATDAQKKLILRVIFIIPFAIMLLGIVVWQVRRRKK